MYYGDENDPMVARPRYRNGTNNAYRLATINVLIKGERFTLKSLLMTQSVSAPQPLKTRKS